MRIKRLYSFANTLYLTVTSAYMYMIILIKNGKCNATTSNNLCFEATLQ